MKKLIVCPKKSGNTFTVCEYVSKNREIDLRVVNKDKNFPIEEYETIILSSGVYVGKAHKNLIKWLESIDINQMNKNTKFYLFTTWFGRGESDRSVLRQINLVLKKIDAKLEKNDLNCFGQGMGVIRIGHPDNKDFEKTLNWIDEL